MGVLTVKSDHPSTSSLRPNILKAAARRTGTWLIDQLALPSHSRLTRAQLAAICAAIFLSALGVRLLYWQDTIVQIEQRNTLLTVLLKEYRIEAQRMITEGGIVFPNNRNPENARMILHPPGYSILLAALYGDRVADGPYAALQLMQITFDGLAAVLVFFIAIELLPLGVAIIAGTVVAFSPHLAYYSLWLTPDSLAVPPVLMAIYLIIRAARQPRLITVIGAGAMVGLSCWLRANALLLSPLLVFVLPLLFTRGKRLRYSAALVATTVVLIAPITIRNWVVFHRFVPLSLSSGLNLVQGIGELDHEGRFDMPIMDRDALKKDVEWNNRPDYGGNLWSPDGIERDRVRFDRGLAVIRSHPLWFMAALMRRAGFMFSYNESRQRDWPFNTATVPLISATPPFGHSLSSIADKSASWSAAPADLISGSTRLSQNARVSLAANGETFQIAGGGPAFEDQFVSAPIPVQQNTDYVLKLSAKLRQGQAAAKVIGADERVVLATAIIRAREVAAAERGRKHSIESVEDTSTMMAFASGKTGEVRLVLSNNGDASVGPIIEIGTADLFELGPTPTLWTHYPRVIIRGVERNIFKTERLLPLVIAGIGLLAFARRGRALMILLVVPVYYVVSHAPFSTEYRYILAIHCFLFVMGAVTLYCAGVSIRQAAGYLRKIRPRRSAGAIPGAG